MRVSAEVRGLADSTRELGATEVKQVIPGDTKGITLQFPDGALISPEPVVFLRRSYFIWICGKAGLPMPDG